MEIRRGDIVTVALPGDYGKPRPAVVIQSDCFDRHPSVVVLPLTTHLVDAPLFRITVSPEEALGLAAVSQVMVDKITAIKRQRIGARIGRIPAKKMVEIERALALFIGLG